MPEEDCHSQLQSQLANRWMTEGQRLLQTIYQTSEPVSYEVYQGLYQKLEIEQQRNDWQVKGIWAYLTWVCSMGILKSLNRTIRGDEEHANQRRDYLSALIAILWSIYFEASAQGKIVERGSYKIIDPDGKLYQFFLGYVQFATGQAVPGYYTANTFAYARPPDSAFFPLSSHYKTDPEQFGIDCRFFGEDNIIPLFPGMTCHLLVGRTFIGEDYFLFIKMEKAGLGSVLEWFEHAVDFLRPLPEVKSGFFREKDIPPELLLQYQNFCRVFGVSPDMTRIFEMWQSIIAMQRALSQQVCELERENSESDQDWEIPSHEQLRQDMLSLITELKEQFSKVACEHDINDNLDVRTGVEVIIDHHCYLTEGETTYRRLLHQYTLHALKRRRNDAEEVTSLTVAPKNKTRRPLATL